MTEDFSALKSAKKLHFVGVGGVSMSSLAVLAKGRGYTVSGSDRNKTDLTEKLKEAGIDVKYEQVAENVNGADAVIYTAAMSADSPELLQAKKLAIPTYKRAAFLGYMMLPYNTKIGVAGMHGKSTTTSMIAEIFLSAGVDPTVVSGAALSSMSRAYHVGKKDYFVFEACEYTDSFLDFFPDISVVLNIDREHVDYFKTMDQTIESFGRYISLGSMAVVNRDDENVIKALSGYKGKVVFFSVNRIGRGYEADDILFKNRASYFTVYRDGKKLGAVKLKVPGVHNIKNALAAIAVADSCGIPFDECVKALLSFGGPDRRFQLIGVKDGIEVRDEYSHHPSEISASLSGIKAMGYKNIWLVFQPHTYSRTKELFSDFVKSLSLADHVILTDIYAAREENIYGISSADLAEKIDGALCISDYDEIAAYLKEHAKEGDLVLTMGAGTANTVGKKFLEL